MAVTSGGTADHAALHTGDVILSAGQARTSDTQALSQALAAARPGDKVTVAIARSG